jgi:hypothetical protein
MNHNVGVLVVLCVIGFPIVAIGITLVVSYWRMK